MAAPAQSGWIEWTPAGSNPGNGRGDPPPIPDQMNAERGHALIYTGGLKVSPYSLPEHNSKGYHSVPTPMLSTACKRHFNVCSEFNHFLNHLRPFQFGQGLQATYLNSSTCVWISATGEKPTSERGFVQYAQGKGMLKTKSGTILYEGDFDQGFRHGQGFSQMEDLSFGFGTYQGAWVWGCRQGWGKFTLDSDGTVFEGNWKRDKLNGCVRVTQPDGGVYTGIFRDNARDGSGRYVWPVGQVEDHLYQRNALASKVVYAVRPAAAPAATAEGGAAPAEVAPSAIVPTLPFIEAFLAQKAAAPAAPVCSEPDDDMVMGEDGKPMKAEGGIESLTGNVILADKILMRTVDEQYIPEVTKVITAAIGKPITVKVDWESIKSGTQPRRGVFTMEKDRSAFVLQPLANIIKQLTADDMTKEALQAIDTITLKQDSGATQSAATLNGKELIISSNFEFGRGSTFQDAPLKKAIEKVL